MTVSDLYLMLGGAAVLGVVVVWAPRAFYTLLNAPVRTRPARSPAK